MAKKDKMVTGFVMVKKVEAYAPKTVLPLALADVLTVLK